MTDTLNRDRKDKKVVEKPAASAEEASPIDVYQKKANYTFLLTIIIYCVCIAVATASVVIGFIKINYPADSFQKTVSVGLLLFGGGLVVLLVKQNPLKILQQYLVNFLRIHIMLKSYDAQVEVITKEIFRLQENGVDADGRKVDLQRKHMQEIMEKVIHQLNFEEEFLDLL